MKRRKGYVPHTLANYRKHWSANDHLFTHVDYGKLGETSNKKIANYYRQVSKQHRWANLIASLVRIQAPKTILELGTALGVSTAYIGHAAPKSSCIHTIEGSEQLNALTKPLLSQIHPNIHQFSGNIDDTLSDVLERADPIDFAFIDANHNKTATIQYVDQIMARASGEVVLVLDDIHWSEGMEEAWDQLAVSHNFNGAFDFFRVGVLVRTKAWRQPISRTVHY